MRHLAALLMLLAVTSLPQAAEPISSDSDAIAVYRTDTAFDEVKEALELAITGQGLLLRDTLHIAEMLERTASDTGLKKSPYAKALSLEFCSISLTYRMAQADPANMAFCPLTISIYSLAEEPDITYLSYRKPQLNGNATEAVTAITSTLRQIVESALEF